MNIKQNFAEYLTDIAEITVIDEFYKMTLKEIAEEYGDEFWKYLNSLEIKS